jgi:hypothetical protein
VFTTATTTNHGQHAEKLIFEEFGILGSGYMGKSIRNTWLHEIHVSCGIFGLEIMQDPFVRLD